MQPIRGLPPIINENYEDRANRDKRAKDLKREGWTVVRRCFRNQSLSPQYVKDFQGTGERTFFARIYVIEAVLPQRVFND